MFVIAALALGQGEGAQAASPAARSAQSANGAIARHVAEAARRFGIPERWIIAVIRVESGGNPRALSPKGAAGLMQLMPPTWAALRVRYALGDDVYDVRDNILAGTAYLRELHDRYGAPGFLAAYNAGPGRYEAWRAGKRRLPAETVAYLRRLAPEIGGAVDAPAPPASVDPFAWRRAQLFPPAASGAPPGAQAGDALSRDEPVSRTAPESAGAQAEVPRPKPSAVLERDSLFVPRSGAQR